MVCKKCGAQLQKDDTFCAACGADCKSKEKEAVKCSECGKFFNKEFGMCPFCGTELAEDNIELTDNQYIPLSVTDTEEAFVEENTEGNFVLCPNCNNKYDINVGLCTICGYSSLESDETVAEEDEASANVSAIEDSTSDKLQNTYNSAYSDAEENKPVNYKKVGIISAVVIGVILVISLIVNGSKLSGVSMNQIESDISELSVVTNGVIESEYTPFTPYTVDSVEIEKRQTNIDDKEDIVYCNVVISNEYYQTDLQIKLVYNYYDDGGWIKDGSSVVSDTTVPIAPIPKDSVDKITVTALKTKIDLTSSYITDITLDDDSYTYTSTINYKYSDDRFVVEGYATTYFENNEWSMIRSDDFVLSSAVPNWTSGHYYTTNKSGEYDHDGILYRPKNAICSMKYYRNQNDKNRNYVINVINPWVDSEITVTSISGNKITGTFIMSPHDKKDKYQSIKQSVTVPFSCEFDTQTGTFEIPYKAEIFSYHSYDWAHAMMGAKDPYTEPCYTTANMIAEISCNFSTGKWGMDIDIASLDVGSSAIIN